MSLIDASKLREELEQRSRRNRSAAPGCSTKAVRREMEVTADTYDKVISLIDQMVQAAEGPSVPSQPSQQGPDGVGAIALKVDDFVRVRRDSEFRAGQDGQVVAPQDSDGNVGLIFGYDRYGEPVMASGLHGTMRFMPSEGVELWNVRELDLTDVDR